jgi:hypothetical protein
VLLFELFPAFMVLVCIVAGVALVKMNLEARDERDVHDRAGAPRSG